jgi:hypothetical protein
MTVLALLKQAMGFVIDNMGLHDRLSVVSFLSALFVWLISHQPAVLFSQNKPAINN